MNGRHFNGYQNGGEFGAGFGNFGPGQNKDYLGDDEPTGVIFRPAEVREQVPLEHVPGVVDPIDGSPMPVQGDKVLKRVRRGTNASGPIYETFPVTPDPDQQSLIAQYRYDQTARNLRLKYPRMSEAELAAKLAEKEQQHRRNQPIAPPRQPEVIPQPQQDNDVGQDLLEKHLPLDQLPGPKPQDFSEAAVVSGAARRLLEPDEEREARVRSLGEVPRGAEVALRTAGVVDEAEQDFAERMERNRLQDVRPPNSSRRARGVEGFIE